MTILIDFDLLNTNIGIFSVLNPKYTIIEQFQLVSMFNKECTDNVASIKRLNVFLTP